MTFLLRGEFLSDFRRMPHEPSLFLLLRCMGRGGKRRNSPSLSSSSSSSSIVVEANGEATGKKRAEHRRGRSFFSLSNFVRASRCPHFRNRSRWKAYTLELMRTTEKPSNFLWVTSSHRPRCKARVKIRLSIRHPSLEFVVGDWSRHISH